ncbi:MAG: MBOAT family O-acyltransferase, partial [Candidatus Hinthialibacter sp.]
MLFTQIEFVLFFAVILILLTGVRSFRGQKLILLAGSYYFYAYWDWRFLSLIFISTLVDFIAGKLMSQCENPKTRKSLLVLSLTVNLGLLGFFKYFNFFIDAAQALLAPLGFHLQSLHIILPVGISFYTFQTLSYTIDIYRKKLEPCHDFFDFALFVSFFPQLVAGPIVRAADFLPQLQTPRRFTLERSYCGGRQFIIGLFKKVFIADRLAMFVDVVFANAGAFDGVTTWLAVIAYAIQIYCDFSGYSDMAIGLARILGFDFHANFNHPYIASSIQDFWRRWHISLSTWLRDYLYIPLGGSRCGKIRTYINLMITMLLGGLWHGAAWTFVFWGGFHGASLAINRWQTEHRKSSPPSQKHPWNRIGGWLLTMAVVLIGWVFFRAPTFSQALAMLRQMFFLQPGVAWLHPFAIFCLGLMAVIHILHACKKETWLELPLHAWHSPAVLFL